MNFWQDDDIVYAEVELPGLKLADLEINVTAGNELMVKGGFTRKRAVNRVIRAGFARSRSPGTCIAWRTITAPQRKRLQNKSV